MPSSSVVDGSGAVIAQAIAVADPALVTDVTRLVAPQNQHPHGDDQHPQLAEGSLLHQHRHQGPHPDQHQHDHLYIASEE
eukprot:5830969-Pleurochrysis_carterae.AAC.1